MRLFAAALVLAIPASAHAWTRPGHMVTAAIAYDELAASDPETLQRLLAIAAHHPDRGPFEVAIGRATGDERSRRVFMELARWPDDVRGGAHDHPTWHHALSPVVDSRAPPPAPPADDQAGAADQAFALNMAVAGDPAAPIADRATALAWVFHIAGDIHQPLHTAQLFSARFPKGDRGGGLQYVRDPKTGEPISLHWFWDDSVNRDGEPEKAVARARALMKLHPRSSFPELETKPTDFGAWRRESYALAAPLTYRADLTSSDAAAEAPDLSKAYVRDATAQAERRLTLAGYRLADLARTLVAKD
ncbi:S1/P1 nuclease [Phenylobacterium sp.]|uniref:S1/P1 nuclease n=1 Tax=Phenylobacterium sp. TaxID=1871053 RepID=UPI0028A2129E|nr:S1/P1 nuclease [Phenylobacterium sp.]